MLQVVSGRPQVPAPADSAARPHRHFQRTPLRLAKSRFTDSNSTDAIRRPKLSLLAQNNDDVRERVSGVVKTGDNLAEGATDALTGGIPRPLVKAGLVGIGGLLAWSLLKRALSLAIVFAVVGGGLYLALRLKFQGNEDSSSTGNGSTDSDDALQKARDIWNKYK